MADGDCFEEAAAAVAGPEASGWFSRIIFRQRIRWSVIKRTHIFPFVFILFLRRIYLNAD